MSYLRRSSQKSFVSVSILWTLVILFLPLATPASSVGPTSCKDVHYEENLPPAGFTPELLGDVTHFAVIKPSGEYSWIMGTENRLRHRWAAIIVGRDPDEILYNELLFRPGIVYRGMSVTPAELRTILKDGIVPTITERARYAPHFDQIFTSSYPDVALEYVKAGSYNRPQTKQYQVLFELKRVSKAGQKPTIRSNGLIIKDPENDPAAELTYARVEPDQILRVFFVDPMLGNSEFPLHEFSASQLRKIFLPQQPEP